MLFKIRSLREKVMGNDTWNRPLMSEHDFFKLSEELDKGRHKRKMELILVWIMTGIVGSAVVILIFPGLIFYIADKISNASSPSGSATATEFNGESYKLAQQWAITTLTTVVGFVIGYVNGRRVDADKSRGGGNSDDSGNAGNGGNAGDGGSGQQVNPDANSQSDDSGNEDTEETNQTQT
ncbi:MAG: hypothetical protein KF784_06420 [Fimbriimonadaceae bacterium]|nr:hypothetical protein [Fimbriimonadaceae bacterium]